MTDNTTKDRSDDDGIKPLIVDPETLKRDGLTLTHVSAYSVGHFNNDLCAAMWFVYLSWYVKVVVKLPPNIVALSLFSGQIADGITTPLVGILSDKFNTRCGKRMPFYIFGTFFVIPTFAGIFTYPPWIDHISVDGKNIWYCSLPALFNVGWASVQISHMSIVNQLSSSNRRRDRLVINRNGFTYAANITVLSFAYLLFQFVDD